ncbi:MAG TPA: hypothetical protein VFK24_00925 [Gammaproteobacteria bacterium]|nr:hypothetical protein [Gammaproteobacteria bacterium]
MRARLEMWVTRANALSLRERGLLMLAVLAVLIGLWEIIFFAPLQHKQAALQKQVATLRGSVADLNRTITQAAEQSTTDPNVALRARLAAARKASAQIDRRLKAITAGLIAPREMAAVLEKVLKAQHGLKLISMTNLPAAPVALGDGKASKAKVFRHGLTLTFEGGYLDTLTYLEKLANLPWHFYWDKLELHVKRYPVSRVTLTVHTLNLKEGWIGV